MLPENNIVLFYLAGTVFIGLLVGFILVYVYIHHLKVKQMHSELSKQELKKQQELYFALQEGEEKERKRLAEELHDGIGAKLSGLKMNLEYLRSKLETQSYDELFSRLVNEMGETINEVRELSHNLKPAFISAQHLKQALSGVVEKLNINSAINCHIEVRIVQDPPIEIKLSVYRIVTEALNNIYKHSKASTAFIQVMEEEGNLQVLIEDNGTGFDANTLQSGNGLYNIQSRVEALNGKSSIDSSSKGTTIIIDIPLTKL